MRRRSLALLAIAIIAASCSRGAEDPKHPLHRVLIDSVPEGYKPVRGPASGPMDISSAASSTLADSGPKRRLLEGNGYKSGYSRVWSKGDDYITALVFEFTAEDGVQELLEFELESLGDKKDVILSPVPQVAGAVGFTVPGVAGRQFRKVFCQGVLFSSLERIFYVMACGPRPTRTPLAARLAESQFRSLHRGS